MARIALKRNQESPPAGGRRPRRRVAFNWKELPWMRIGAVMAVFAVIGAVFYAEFDVDDVRAQAARLPGPAAFGLLLVLPLLGFPVNLLHVAAGMRFGGTTALGLVALATLIQLTASYAIVRRWRPYFERARWIARLRKRIPQGAHAGVSVFTVLLPGAPYAAINYALPLLGVPLRTILLCTFPIHVLRSTVTIALGDQLGQLTATRLLVLAAYALAILGASWWTFRRLNARLADQPPAAGGQTQSA